MEDLGPLLGQSPVEQDRSHLLGGLVHREVLADHDAKDVSEMTWLQSPCGASQTILDFTATERRNKSKERSPGCVKERARGGNKQKNG